MYLAQFVNFQLIMSLLSALIIIKFSNMEKLINRICPRQQLQFDPTQWGKRLGQKCEVCSTNMSHQKCLSFCKCYYFYHQKCFALKFQQSLTHESLLIKCKHCQQKLMIDLDVLYTYTPSFTLPKMGRLAAVLILLIINLIAVALTLRTQMDSQILFFMFYCQFLTLALLVYLTVMYARDCLYKKMLKIKEVTSTRLQIQTSAFKDIDLQSCEQITKEILFDSKK